MMAVTERDLIFPPPLAATTVSRARIVQDLLAPRAWCRWWPRDEYGARV